MLPADSRYPDGTFVEDAAVITGDVAIATRLGARTRAGEVPSIVEALRPFGLKMHHINAPGTVDAGDVCEAADQHFFIGLSRRTNKEGARQLASILGLHGCTSSLIDIQGISSLLHLKSGMAYLGDNRLVVAPELSMHLEWQGYELIETEPDEAYAANCVRINEHVLVAAGYPRIAQAIRTLGYSVLTLQMSEFRKMDGGMSCLSLRF